MAVVTNSTVPGTRVLLDYLHLDDWYDSAFTELHSFLSCAYSFVPKQRKVVTIVLFDVVEFHVELSHLCVIVPLRNLSVLSWLHCARRLSASSPAVVFCFTTGADCCLTPFLKNCSCFSLLFDSIADFVKEVPVVASVYA